MELRHRRYGSGPPPLPVPLLVAWVPSLGVDGNIRVISLPVFIFKINRITGGPHRAGQGIESVHQ